MSTAIVTGASSGIGRELARLCAANGYDLILVARNEAQLETVAAEIRSESQRAVRIIVDDLSDAGAPQRIFAATTSELGGIEMLINNAGVGMLGFFADLDMQKQMDMLQLNVNALTHLCRLYAPGMIARKKGYILNVASTAAFQPGPLMAVYYASKAYVVSFSEALHNELKDAGVTVTVLCPGPTTTEFQKRARMESTKLFAGGNAMDAAKVAEIGYAAMQKGKSLVVAGARNALMAFGTRFAPRQMAAGLARKMQE